VSLEEGGVLQIGRTDDLMRRHEVTFFRKVGPGKLTVLDEHNGGTENLCILRDAGLVR
jgi:hypothetical protein